MVKRNLKLLTALALTLSLSTGIVTTHAAVLSDKGSNDIKQIKHTTTHKDKCREGSISSVLKNKLGFTEEQIDSAKKSGKTAFDLAKEKGVTPDKLRTMIIDAKSEKIDEAVKEGKIEKEKADSIKSHIKDKVQNWDGTFRQKNNTNKTQ